MRPRLSFLLLALLFAVPMLLRAQDPFPTDFPPSLTYKETYHDKVIADPDFPGEYTTVSETLLTITGKCSMQGVDTSEFDENTEFSIEFEALSLTVSLGGDSGDPNYTPGKTAATIPLLDFEGNAVGSVALAWTAAQLTYTIRLENDPDNYVKAPDLAFSGEQDDAYEDLGTVTVSFGDRELSGRLVYIGDLVPNDGVRSRIYYTTVTRNGEEFPLTHVVLEGEIDSKVPTNLAITRPFNNRTKERPYTLKGTAKDNYGISEILLSINGGPAQAAQYDGTLNWTLPGVVFTPGVNVVTMRAIDQDGNEAAPITASISFFTVGPTEVTIKRPPNGRTNQKPYTITGTANDDFGIAQVIVNVNGGPDQVAEYDAALKTWALPGVVLKPGSNSVAMRAIDIDGNIETATPVNIFYDSLSPLTVRTIGMGAGQVSARFTEPPATFETMVHLPGATGQQVVPNRQEDEIYTITAAPGAASLFNGWTAVGGPALENAMSPKLTFKMFPNMTLVAEFIPNPFIPVKGTYSGLAESADPKVRGFFTAKLNSNGTFTGTVKITTPAGLLTVPIKGPFSNAQQFSGSIRKGAATYNLTLALDTTGSGRITGRLTGPNGLDVSLAGDLAAFKNKVRELSADDVGSYNMLLEGADSNVDPKPPAGISWGRVTLSKLGAAKFVGKLSDGSTLSASATLSQAKGWPFFASLYGGKGTVAGALTLDRTQPASDISGTLHWYHPVMPPKTKVHPEEFSGALDALGVKYPKPAAGQAILLTTAGENTIPGDGTISFDAPAATVNGAPFAALSDDWNVTVPATNKPVLEDPDPALQPTPEAASVKLSLNTATGMFTGSFVDGGKTFPFSGVILPGPKRDAAGGFFIRGNRTGAVVVQTK